MPGVSGVSGVVTLPFGGQTYLQKVLDTGPIAGWILGEAAGPVAECIVNSPAQDGTSVGITPGQPGPISGHTAYLFDGLNDYVDIFSVALRAAWNGSEGSTLMWLRVLNVGVWTDGIARVGMHVGTGANNYIDLRRPVVNNTVSYFYNAGGVTKIVAHVVGQPIDWMCMGMTWSALADEVRCYFNGAQAGLTQVGLGVWAGVLVEGALGARDLVPTRVWDGWGGWGLLWDTPLPPATMAQLAVV
jgi:hypothetical protein